MILKQSIIDLAGGMLRGNWDVEATTGVLNSSICLRGTNKYGGSLFTASAAPVMVKDGSAYIVTAKHNLTVWGQPEPEPNPWPPDDWDESLLNEFKNRISIYYGQTNANDMALDSDPMGGNWAKIRAIVPIWTETCTSTTNPWSYDVIVLESTDSGLRKWINTRCHRPSLEKLKSLIDGFRNNEGAYLRPGYRKHLQVGFGTDFSTVTADSIVGGKLNVGDNVTTRRSSNDYHAGHLQYRIPIPKAATSVTVQTLTTTQDGAQVTWMDHESAVICDGNKQNTTAKGDSGGPIWYYDKDTKYAIVIGVTLGGDMVAAEKLTRPFANTVFTSLAPYYDQLTRQLP
jgi:hypothetical protein